MLDVISPVPAFQSTHRWLRSCDAQVKHNEGSCDGKTMENSRPLRARLGTGRGTAGKMYDGFSFVLLKAVLKGYLGHKKRNYRGVPFKCPRFYRNHNK